MTQTTLNYLKFALQPVQPNETCDAACPANALVAVQMTSGQRLTFCGHHYDSQSALHRVEVYVLDSRWVQP